MFNTLFVNPLYNAFVALLEVIPHTDAGLGIVLFTIIVSLFLYPVSKKALETQLHMKQYEVELRELKERFVNNKEEQARRIMSFYKEKGINPFASLFLIFIQLPIIIALYLVFARSGLPIIDTGRLYSFISVPTQVNMSFLGLIDIAHKSFLLAFVAALAQFIQGWYSPAFMEINKSKVPKNKPSFEESFASSMRFQMKYFLPGVIFLVSYQYSGVIALYFATRSFFMFFQELIMRNQTNHLLEPLTNGHTRN